MGANWADCWTRPIPPRRSGQVAIESAIGPSDNGDASRSQTNEKKIAKAELTSKVHFRKPPGKPMPEAKKRANSARSRPRSGVEHVFADQKHHMRLFIRTIAVARAKTKIGIANIAHNMRRYLFWQAKAAAL